MFSNNFHFRRRRTGITTTMTSAAVKMVEEVVAAADRPVPGRTRIMAMVGSSRRNQVRPV